MSAGIATTTQLLATGFYENLAQKTKNFVAIIQNYCDQKGYVVNIPSIGSIFWIAFSKEDIRAADQIDATTMDYFKVLHKELLERGIYLGPSGYEVGFISAAHSDEVLEEAAAHICAAMDVVFAG